MSAVLAGDDLSEVIVGLSDVAIGADCTICPTFDLADFSSTARLTDTFNLVAAPDLPAAETAAVFAIFGADFKRRLSVASGDFLLLLTTFDLAGMAMILTSE